MAAPWSIGCATRAKTPRACAGAAQHHQPAGAAAHAGDKGHRPGEGALGPAFDAGHPGGRLWPGLQRGLPRTGSARAPAWPSSKPEARRSQPFPIAVRGESVGSWAYADDDLPRSLEGSNLIPSDERRPVVSDIPPLLISGGWDAVTSPAWAKAVATGLSSSTVVVIHGSGHFVSPGSLLAPRR